jgi:hypothetical protein
MEERSRIKELPNPDAPRLPIIDECSGCHYVFTKTDGTGVCVPYWNPAAKWRLGCPMATNRVVEKVEQKKVNPLKASKKAKKGA